MNVNIESIQLSELKIISFWILAYDPKFIQFCHMLQKIKVNIKINFKETEII